LLWISRSNSDENSIETKRRHHSRSLTTYNQRTRRIVADITTPGRYPVRKLFPASKELFTPLPFHGVSQGIGDLEQDKLAKSSSSRERDYERHQDGKEKERDGLDEIESEIFGPTLDSENLVLKKSGKKKREKEEGSKFFILERRC